MQKITDPATELAKVLEKLSGGGSQAEKGSVFLAHKFGVEEWSLDFYQIVFSIIQRIEKLRTIFEDLPEFEHLRGDISGHLDVLKSGFTDHAMRNAWQSVGMQQVSAPHIQPLKMCSALLRQKYKYPELSEEERNGLINEVSTLVDWLKSHQIEEADFIRQALIDGLEQFSFRLARLEWIGWEHPLESLKAVIMAYVALERGQLDPANAPHLSAVIKRTSSTVRKILEVIGVPKEVYDNGEFFLQCYGAVSAMLDANGGVAGLLK